MSDCENVELRELLPEYLHDRLENSERARVDAHLASCEDCAAELSTLRSVRRVLSRVPAVDTGAIVRALPRPARPHVRFTRATRSRALAWRLAAAISFISLGGISLAVARSFFNGQHGVATVDTARQVAVTVPDERRPVISFAGGVSDLPSADVETLLGNLDKLEAAPPAEPDAVEPGDVRRVKPDSTGE